MNNLLGFLFPNENVATVTASDDVLTLWTIEVNTLNCETQYKHTFKFGKKVLYAYSI
jgi:hypothetical protein